MPTIVRIGNVLIRMFADDHVPPHFHVVTSDHQALVAIETLDVIAGTMDRRSLDAALKWAAANMETLKAEWRRLNER